MELVDGLPHLEADHLADRARVLARGGDRAARARRGCPRRQSGSAAPARRRPARRGSDARSTKSLSCPATMTTGCQQRARGSSASSARAPVTCEHAGGALGALEVAPEPEAVVGDAAITRRRSDPRLLLKHPGVLRAAALARVDDVRSLAQRDAREPSREHPRPVAAGQDEGAQVDPARREDAPRGDPRSGRWRARCGAARCSCAARRGCGARNSSRSAAVDCGPMSMP